MIQQIHHVQITIPKGQENQAREFYCKVLGLEEIEKPKVLVERGGFWIGLGDLQIHIGVEDGINRQLSKAHLAYKVKDIQSWRKKLLEKGIKITESIPIPGYERFEFRDPFGNRVEFLETKI